MLKSETSPECSKPPPPGLQSHLAHALRITSRPPSPRALNPPPARASNDLPRALQTAPARSIVTTSTPPPYHLPPGLQTTSKLPSSCAPNRTPNGAPNFTPNGASRSAGRESCWWRTSRTPRVVCRCSPMSPLLVPCSLRINESQSAVNLLAHLRAPVIAVG